MRIGIVGGGISGLYLANLLKERHDVTIFESNEWGGDIRSEQVGDKCYPVSTLFAMPGDVLLRREIERLHLRTRRLYPPGIVFLIALIVVVVVVSKASSSKSLSVAILAITALGVMYALKRIVCDLVLAFGADKDCGALHKFYTYAGGVKDLLFRSMLYMEDCGPSTIVDSYLNDTEITYIERKVVSISRNEDCTFRLDDGRTMRFDKCIITTGYESYKDVLKLSEDETKLLAGTPYFDFYSTLVVTSAKGHVDVKKSIKRFTIEHGVYLFASHEPIEVDPSKCTFYKAFKWRMPRVHDAKQRQRINTDDVTRTVFFAGKEMAGNGVNHCMQYALKLSRLI